jgi:hypothetical protein
MLIFYLLFRKIRKSQSDNESFDTEFVVEDDWSDDDDERPDSVDDITRKKEMRKGMDLATTLERIEKNFVITDPRLPDNPIVRILPKIFSVWISCCKLEMNIYNI